MHKCDLRLDLEFRDLTFAIKDSKGKEKQILHNINGRCQSGRLTAVLGSSGAGKTSLLNVLSGFKTRGVCGSITINGDMWKPEDIRKSSCYIPQEFSMLPNLTTRETLFIAAQLKLGSKQNCEVVVDQILELLSLQKTVNTYVKNISGGEKKRLSIGVELVTNPPIMFLDEPISGLDSLSSVQVISHLKSLAEGGRNIICVIHQPSSRLFQMFDDTVLVSEGQCIYHGQIDRMVQVFESVGFPYPIYYNLADFALEVACRERGTCIQELVEYSRRKILSLKSENNYSQFCLNEDLINEKSTMIDNNCKSTTKQAQPYRKWNYSTQYPISRLEQFSILLKRSFLGAMRDTHLAYIRLITHVIVGLLLGILYFRIGNDASKVESNTACLFFFIMFLFFSNAVPTVHAFPLEASVFMREHLNNWYCLISYYFAKLLSDIPLQLLCPSSFVLIAYFMTGQPCEGDRFLKFLLVCLLITMIAQTFGLATGAAFDMQLGTFIVAAATIPMFLFSGFFLRLKDIPVYLYPISYLSIFRFSFEAMMLSIYSERSVLQCNEIYCHFRYPEKLLKNMDVADASYWCDIGIMVGYLLIFQVVLYLVLTFKLRNAL